MKTNIIPAIRLTLITLVFFSGAYTALIWSVVQLTPNRGKGEMMTIKGKKYYANIGQTFSADKCFWSRPSAVGYNAAGSGGSNKGPSNPEYLQLVRDRIDTFLVHNPGIARKNIPVELVTASGSGLDPDITLKAALVQIKRISKVRQLPENRLREIIEKTAEGPLFGLFGPSKVNVLKLNIALENI